MIRFLLAFFLLNPFFSFLSFSGEHILSFLEKVGDIEEADISLSDESVEEQEEVSSLQNSTHEMEFSSKSDLLLEEKPPLFHLYADFLYFKVSEDAIKYAEKFPQDSSINPTTSEIKQDFCYSPGVRIGAGVPTYFDKWKIEAEWTYLYSHPSARHSNAKEFGILASLVIPTWGALGNSSAEHVRGHWHLTFNSANLNLQRAFYPSDRIGISAYAGILAGFIDQKMSVHYKDFRIDFTEVTTPRKVISHGWMSSVGPFMGVNLACLLPKQFDLFFKYSVGMLGGMFSVKTNYKDFSKSSEKAHVTIKDSYTRMFTVQQMQAGISKEWSCQGWSVALALGWEFQQWTHQMQMRWFSSFTQAQDPADLSFYGPFLKVLFRF